jgi:hypothetical protein
MKKPEVAALWVFAIMICIGIWLYLSSDSKKVVIVREGEWTTIRTYPTREILRFEPREHRRFEWIVVVNKNFSKPIMMGPTSPSETNFGDCVSYIDLTLTNYHGEAEFIIRRFPRTP